MAWTRRHNNPNNKGISGKDIVVKYGKWAIVTGPTSGIGQSFAENLASRGMNLLLISRNEQKLQQTASRIQQQYPNVCIQYIIRDFAQEDTNFSPLLHAKLLDLTSSSKIGILINAVGVVNTIPSVLHKTPKEDLEEMLFINNYGTLQMTMEVLPYMLRQKSGAIITVSSGSCIHPTPMLSVYSATKAFGHTLTRGLYDFFESQQQYGCIDCLSLRPYYFVSNMIYRKHATFLVPFPDVIATAALDVLGYEGDAAPYWAHYLGALLSKWTPHDPAESILHAMQRTRAQHLLKRNKQQKQTLDSSPLPVDTSKSTSTQ
jgi:17beta-estradiol 17-dehydrogenase / very-long-chain 3-oxoacyl-CoA reductase